MITLRVTTELTADRQVVITLPNEVPLGTVELVVNVATQPKPTDGKPFRTSLAEWAAEDAEDFGDKISSTDVARFTGREF